MKWSWLFLENGMEWIAVEVGAEWNAVGSCAKES